MILKFESGWGKIEIEIKTLRDVYELDQLMSQIGVTFKDLTNENNDLIIKKIETFKKIVDDCLDQYV